MTDEVPLCVDLDGTLVWTDTLVESVRLLCLRAPIAAVRVPIWLTKGRAYLKEQIAAHVIPDVATLPYNEPLLAFLRAEKLKGRTLVLATAAHERIATAVANHIGLFDVVMATTAQINLKSTRKGDALVARFGLRQFDYVGDALADLPVWTQARRVYVAGHDPALMQQLQHAGLEVDATFGVGIRGVQASLRRLLGQRG